MWLPTATDVPKKPPPRPPKHTYAHTECNTQLLYKSSTLFSVCTIKTKQQRVDLNQEQWGDTLKQIFARKIFIAEQTRTSSSLVKISAGCVFQDTHFPPPQRGSQRRKVNQKHILTCKFKRGCFFFYAPRLVARQIAEVISGYAGFLSRRGRRKTTSHSDRNKLLFIKR